MLVTKGASRGSFCFRGEMNGERETVETGCSTERERERGKKLTSRGDDFYFCSSLKEKIMSLLREN